MLGSIIVDDEKDCREALTALLTSFCPEVTLLTECQNVQEAISAIHLHKPQLVFLDVEMPGEDGFALFSYFSKIDFNIIFVTAYDRYAVKAFKYSALDYLLKPVDHRELITAVARAKDAGQQDKQQQLDLLKENVTQRSFAKVALPTLSGYEFIPLKEIVRLEGEENYTRVHKTDGKKLLSSMSLKPFEEMLPQDTFFRSHRSDIVNLNFIKQYNKKEGGQLVLEDDTVLPLARRRKDEFLSLFGKR